MDCPICHSHLKTTRLECNGCGVVLEGRFSMPRLARLSREHQILAEAFLVSGGNFKELAEQLGASYPTLRKRMDDLIAALEELRATDRKTAEQILVDIEAGRIKADEGLRQIKEMNGEL